MSAVPTPQEEVRFAGDARFILEQPLFLKAKEEIYSKLRAARQSLSTKTDPQAAMDLVRLEQIADQFFAYFDLVLQTGRLAEQHLADQSVQEAKRQSGLKLFSMFGRQGL
jgi:hypothetical protein